MQGQQRSLVCSELRVGGGMASAAFIYRIHLLIWPLTLQQHCSVMNSRIVSFRTLDSESNSQMAALMAKETVSNPSRLLT